MNQKDTYWIYLLVCSNNAYYAGFTKDLALRFKKHVTGKAGSKYTRSFQPTKIVQSWCIHESMGKALKVEQLIKKLSRKMKTKIIENPLELKTLIQQRLQMNMEIVPVKPADLQELNKDVGKNSC